MQKDESMYRQSTFKIDNEVSLQENNDFPS